MTPDILMNERIRAQSVRLIDGNGNQSGVLSLYEAIRRARSMGLDLVQVAKGDIPVCKILDVDRWRYEQAKAARETARRQREMQVEIKEIQLRPVTDENDLAVKSRRAKAFLAEGDKVKIVVRFKGRERTHRDQGRLVVEKFLAMLGEHKVDSALQNGDKDMVMVLAPMISKSEIVRARNNPMQAAAE